MVFNITDYLENNMDYYYQTVNVWFQNQQYYIMGNYPDAYQYVNQITSYECFMSVIVIMFYLLLLDKLVIQHAFKKARWFVLHAIGNAFVINYTWRDVLAILLNPIKSYSRTPNYTGLNITVGLHFYHILFFSNLPVIDWVHHVLMMYVAISSYYCPPAVNIATNGLLFFLNGLPGGLDYVLLSLVKYEIIKPIREKELNSYLNIWIRSPGILINTYNLYMTSLYTKFNPSLLTVIPILIILIWNAQYFTYRVVGNYFAKLVMKSNQLQQVDGNPPTEEYLGNCLDEKDMEEELKHEEETPIKALVDYLTDTDVGDGDADGDEDIEVDDTGFSKEKHINVNTNINTNTNTNGDEEPIVYYGLCHQKGATYIIDKEQRVFKAVPRAGVASDLPEEDRYTAGDMVGHMENMTKIVFDKKSE